MSAHGMDGQTLMNRGNNAIPNENFRAQILLPIAPKKPVPRNTVTSENGMNDQTLMNPEGNIPEENFTAQILPPIVKKRPVPCGTVTSETVTKSSK